MKCIDGLFGNRQGGTAHLGAASERLAQKSFCNHFLIIRLAVLPELNICSPDNLYVNYRSFSPVFELTNP